MQQVLRSSYKSAWSLSIGLHFSALLILLIIYFISRSRTQIIPLEVIENPVVSTAPVVNTTVQPQLKVEEPKRKAVFGVSRKSWTDTSESRGTSVKTGNTVAKEQDNETLSEDDADQLPIPSDEFAVTAMPSLKKEVRVSYPEEAKKRNIQGPVVLDLLIDQFGKVRQATVINGPGFGLNEAAQQALMQFEFTPARIQQKNVAVKIRYIYRFVLEK